MCTQNSGLCHVKVKRTSRTVSLSHALCRAALVRLPSSAALCEKSKRRRQVGREPIFRRLGTVHGHWCWWIDVAPDVNKNGEIGGSNMPRYLCLTSEHLMPPSGFYKTSGHFFSRFHLNPALTARLMIFIWHKSHSRRAASSNKHSGKNRSLWP